MLKIASLTASALIIAGTLYVAPAEASMPNGQETVGSQTVVSWGGCGWHWHWSRRWQRCVPNW